MLSESTPRFLLGLSLPFVGTGGLLLWGPAAFEGLVSGHFAGVLLKD